MIRYQRKSQAKPQFTLGFVDNLYYSCSLEFWLSIATVGIAADWIFKFGAESLMITLAWAGVLSTYIFSTSRIANRLWYDLRSLEAPRHLGLWLTGLAALTTLFFVNAMTDPAHALIITSSGVASITNLLSGNVATNGSAGTPIAGAAGVGLGAFAGTVITLIKVLFALAFLFGIYGSYQKYQERAELQEIVQGPIVLIVAVLAIDGVLALIFGNN